MASVLSRYTRQPDAAVAQAATQDPRTAAALAQRWAHAGPDEGLIVAVDDRSVIYCPPRSTGRDHAPSPWTS